MEEGREGGRQGGRKELKLKAEPSPRGDGKKDERRRTGRKRPTTHSGASGSQTRAIRVVRQQKVFFDIVTICCITNITTT